MQELVETLRRARDHARRHATVAHRFAFGARDLLIHGTPHDEPLMPRGDLIEIPTGQGPAPTVDLYLLDRATAESIEFPSVALSAYGAVRQSLETDWVVLRSPDTGRVLALDAVEGSAIYHPGHPLPPRDRAEFCRPLLHWLAVLDGNVVLHAGAVARDGGAVIVAGGGNVGKTTLIRACLAAGFAMLGDNVVEVSRAEQGPSQVIGVYPTVKVRPDPIVPLPTNWPAPQWDDEARKHIYSLANVIGAGFTRDPQEIAALLVLDDEAPPAPITMPLASAVFKVAPNTVGQFPLFEEQVLRRCSAVLSRLKLLTSGKMPVARIPHVIGTILTGPTGET